MDQHSPILLFDSGVGGLPVLGELRALLPQAPVIYAADFAGLPYGTKSEAEVAAAAEVVHAHGKRMSAHARSAEMRIKKPL